MRLQRLLSWDIALVNYLYRWYGPSGRFKFHWRLKSNEMVIVLLGACLSHGTEWWFWSLRKSTTVQRRGKSLIICKLGLFMIDSVIVGFFAFTYADLYVLLVVYSYHSQCKTRNRWLFITRQNGTSDQANSVVILKIALGPETFKKGVLLTEKIWDYLTLIKYSKYDQVGGASATNQ